MREGSIRSRDYLIVISTDDTKKLTLVRRFTIEVILLSEQYDDKDMLYKQSTYTGNS